MTSSAETREDTGALSVPISSAPVGMTVNVPTVNRVMAVVEKLNVPSIAMAPRGASLRREYWIVVLAAIKTLSFAAGSRPSDQMLGSDQLPLRTLAMVGLVTKRGMTSCSVMIWVLVTVTPPG